MHLVEGFLIRALAEGLLSILQSCENYGYVKGSLLLYGKNGQIIGCISRRYLLYLWDYRIKLELEKDTIKFLDKLLITTDR